MDRLKRDAVLIRLIDALRKRGSWCGETHVQKASFLLQEMLAVKMGFDFILYKHGPFSFDLRDELAAMRGDGFIALRVQNRDYGPSIVPQSAGEALCSRFPRTLKEHDSRIEFVAERVAARPVVELERLATAFFVLRDTLPGADASACARRTSTLKPHISIDQAIDAVQTVKAWHNDAKALNSEEQRAGIR